MPAGINRAYQEMLADPSITTVFELVFVSAGHLLLWVLVTAVVVGALWGIARSLWRLARARDFGAGLEMLAIGAIIAAVIWKRADLGVLGAAAAGTIGVWAVHLIVMRFAPTRGMEAGAKDNGAAAPMEFRAARGRRPAQR